MGALSATWKPVIRKPFEPLVPNIEFVRAGDPIAMYEAFSATGLGQYGKGPVAAVILELIQGEAGVRPLDVAYVKKVRELCDINHALLIIDEVQTGIGRTGSWFAFQREDLTGGITPDIVTFAKGVAGGFPMGGMISFGGKLSALFTPGSHGSTFAGNPWARRRPSPRWTPSRTSIWSRTPKSAASNCARASWHPAIRCSPPCAAAVCSTPSSCPTAARMRR